MHPENSNDKEITVPKDLNECFVELDKILSRDDKKNIMELREGDIVTLHHSLGLWIRNNWGLWKGSRLSKWFNERGISHPDDMSGIILMSYWRYEHKENINLDEQFDFYKEYWNTVNENKYK